MADDTIAKLKVSIEADTAKYKAALEKASGTAKQVTKAIDSEIRKMQAPFEKVRAAIDRVQLAMGRKVETKAYAEVTRQLSDAQGELSKLLVKMEELKKSGGATEQTDRYKKLVDQMREAKENLAAIEAQQKELKASGRDMGGQAPFFLEKEKLLNSSIDIYTKKLLRARQALASAQAKGEDTSGLENEISSYLAKISQAQRGLSDLKENFRKAVAAGNVKPSREMEELSAKADEARARVESLRESMDRLSQTGGNTQESAAWASLREEAGNLGERIGELTERKYQLSSSGQAVESSSNKENQAFRAMKVLLSGLSVTLSGLSRGFSAILSGIRKTSGAFAAMIQKFATGIPHLKLFNNEMRKTNSLTDSAKGIVKNLLRYGLGIRGLFALFNKIRRAIKEGMDNLVQYDKTGQLNQSLTTLHSSLIQLKNSLAAAFAPILVAITPALNQLIQLVIKAADAVGQLMSALTGVPYVKAAAVTEDYATSIENAGKKAKKAKKETKELENELMGFDRINKLSDDKDTNNDDDDDDDDGKLKPSQMFEPGTVASKWQELADKIKEIIKGLMDVVKKAWAQEGQKVIDSFRRALQRVKKLIADIAKTFYKVFTDGYGFDWLVSLFDLVSKILDVIGAIAYAFDEAWNDNDAGYKYVASIFEMFTAINKMLSDIARDFAKAWESEAGIRMASAILRLLTTINQTVKKIADAFRTAWNIDDRGYKLIKTIMNTLSSILDLISDITRDFGLAFESTSGINMLGTIIDMFRYIVRSIGYAAEAFRSVWNDNGYGLSILQTIMDMWSVIFGILGDVARDFGKVFKDGSGKEMIRSILGLFEQIHIIIGSVAMAFRNAWNDQNRGYLYINSIAKLISSIAGLLHSIGEAFVAAWEEGGLGEEIMGTILEIVTGIHDTISGFAEAIERGWEAGENGKRIWRAIFKLVNTILGKFNDIVQATKDWAQDLDFGPVFEAFGTLLEKIEPIAETITGALAEGWKNVLLPLGKWTIEKALPGVLEALGSALKVIDSVLSTLEPAFTPLWENVIKPLTEKTGAAIIIVLRWITDRLTDLSNWISQHSEGFSKFVEVVGTFVGTWLVGNGIAGIIGGITKALGGIITALTGAGGVVPAISLLVGGFNPILLGIAAVATGVVLLITHWDDLKTAVHECMEATKRDIDEQLENLPNLTDALSGLNTVIAELEGTSGVTAEGIQTLKQAVSDSSVVNESAAEAVTHFKEACEKAGVGPETLAEACRNAGIDLDSLGVEAGDTKTAVSDLAEETTAASDSMAEGWRNHQDAATESLEGVNTSIKEVESAVSGARDTTTTETEAMNSAWNEWKKSIEDFHTAANGTIEGSQKSITDLSDVTDTGCHDMSMDWADYNAEVERCQEAINQAVSEGNDYIKDIASVTKDTSEKSRKSWEDIESDTTKSITNASDTVNSKSGAMKDDVTDANTKINKDTAAQWDDIRLSVDTAFASIYSGSMEWVKKLREDLYDKFETIAKVLPKKFNGIDDDIGEKFMDVGEKVKGKVDEDKIPEYFEDMAGDIVSRFTSTAPDIAGKFNETGRLIENAVNAPVILDFFQGISDNAVNKFSSTASDIASKFNGIANAIQNAIDPQAIGRTADTAAQYLVAPFQSARQQIDSMFTNFTPFDLFAMYNMGQRAGQSLADGFKNTYIPTPHMYISRWDPHDNGNGGRIYTPGFSVQWYAKGGFPSKGEMFVANENGIEAMGKMGNRNVVANNQQIVDGIRAGVLDAMLTASRNGNQNGGQRVQVDVYLDGKNMTREVVKRINQQSKAAGSPAIAT